MMKKLSIIFAALLLILSFTACGGSKDSSSAEEPKAVVKLVAIGYGSNEVDETQLQTTLDYIKVLLNESGRSDYSAGLNYDSNQIIIKFSDDVTDEEVNALTVLPELTFRNPVGETVMDGSYVEKATAGYDDVNDSYYVEITFTDEGTEKFAEITQEYIGQQVAIFLDETMLMNPTIRNVITDGKAWINNDSFTADDAEALAAKINASSLQLTLGKVLN